MGIGFQVKQVNGQISPHWFYVSDSTWHSYNSVTSQEVANKQGKLEGLPKR